MRPRLACAVLCAALGAPCLLHSPAAAFPADWPPAYLDALAETSTDATPDRVDRQLVPILPTEPLVRWDANQRVLVATWVGSTNYWAGKPVGYTETVNPNYPIWIALPDELKGWVSSHAFPEEELVPRNEQLNGMPPGTGKSMYIEFWVKPDGLFRPSPDPEITDYEALMDFPDNAYTAVDPAYVAWFNNLRAISYTSDTAHPWSRLGYTWDWGNPYNHFGVSEYIIGGGAEVEVATKTPTEEYLPLSATVIDTGLGDRPAAAGSHIVLSACATLPFANPPMPHPASAPHPLPGTRCDIYILVIAPSGEVTSLLPSGALVADYVPYATVARNGERICATLLDYTVEEPLAPGVWQAMIAVLPAGAPPLPGHVLTSAETSVVVE